MTEGSGAGSGSGTLVVRRAGPDDARFAEAASAMIAAAAKDNDIAEREPELLEEKIRSGKAAVALEGERLVGFGYFSEWQGGAFVSHSGLVVDPSLRGQGVGRRLKMALFEASEEMYPDATTMSLTTSEAVKAMNRSLGFRVVPFEEMTTDERFWDGCKTCRNYERVRAEELRCCCEGMIRPPGGA